MESRSDASADHSLETISELTAEDHIRAAIGDLKKRAEDGRRDHFLLLNSPTSDDVNYLEVIAQASNIAWRTGTAQVVLSQLEQLLHILEKPNPT